MLGEKQSFRFKSKRFSIFRCTQKRQRQAKNSPARNRSSNDIKLPQHLNDDGKQDSKKLAENKLQSHVLSEATHPADSIQPSSRVRKELHKPDGNNENRDPDLGEPTNSVDTVISSRNIQRDVFQPDETNILPGHYSSEANKPDESYKLPTYVPSYISPVGFGATNHAAIASAAAAELVRRSRSCKISSTTIKSKSFKATDTTSNVTPTSDLTSRNDRNEEFTKLKAKYRSKKVVDPVSVRDAVAAMESRLNKNDATRPNKPVAPKKPTHLMPKKPSNASQASTQLGNPPSTKNLTPNSSRIKDEKANQKQSDLKCNSDVSFLKKKELWNQKSNTENVVKKGNDANEIRSPARSKPFKGNISNSVTKSPTAVKPSAIENKKLAANKNNQTSSAQKSFLHSKNESPTNRAANNEKSAMKSPDVASPPRGPNSPRPIPPLPPRLRGSKPHLVTANEQKVVSAGSHSDTSHIIEAEMSSSPGSNSLSVSEKAMLFGGSKAKKDAERSNENISPLPERRDTSWLYDADKKSSNKPIEDQSKSNRLPRHSDNSGITSYHKDRRKKREEEEQPGIREFQRHAWGRRAKRPSCDSNASFDSFDADDHQGNNPLLGNVGRRQSRDINDTQPFELPENSFKRSSSVPNSFKKSQTPTLIEEGGVQCYQRSSALQSAIESQLFSSGLSSSNNSSPQDSLKQSNEDTRGTFSNNSSPHLHRNAVLRSHSRERAHTGDSAKSPPALPPKLNRFHRSGSGNRLLKSTEEKGRKPLPPVPFHGKPGNLPQKKANSCDEFTTKVNIDSRNSSQEEFSALKMYNDAAKELNEGNFNRRSGSACSSLSIDSGFRASLEVPSKGANITEWSDFDNSDEDDSVLGSSQSARPPENRTPSPNVPQQKETNEVKLHNIAKELLSTEESYVSVLHLIDQVFHKQILEAAIQKHILPEQVVNNIFCHIPAIYQFHSNFLLPQLKERLNNWETKPKIGDIMTRAAPFLKMYSLYVQNFDEAMNTIKLWSEKSSAFKTIIQNIQKTPECQFLTLQHHMLGPVQRVPRYQMLLADYVKRLPKDSEDRQDSETALDLITNAATHSNETMKKIEKFHKLVNVFNSLVDVNFDIVDVTRELLKEGKIIKISARNGEKYERYLYLFSDMLLCCSPLRRLQGKSYKVTAKIDLEGMLLTEVKNQAVPFAFCVNGLQRSMEFATNSAEDTETWMSAIQEAIDECLNRRQTFRNFATENNVAEEAFPTQSESADHSNIASPIREDFFVEIPDSELGTRAPRWVKDQEVTMCMICSKTFNKIRRRRHHCRACGRVVCGECSEHKFHLQYDQNKAQKICSRCFDILHGQRNSDSSDGEKKGVLEVEADIMSADSVLAEYLYCCENERKKSWIKTWCVIPKDELCLYFYGAHQDIKAQMTVPLPGFNLSEMESCNDHKHCFKLSQGRAILIFGCNDFSSAERWLYALKQACRGENISRNEVWNLGKTNSSDSDGSNEE